MTFNEWMLHIYKQLNYPETKIKAYESSIRCKTTIPNHQRWTEQSGRNATIGADKDNSVVKGN